MLDRLRTAKGGVQDTDCERLIEMIYRSHLQADEQPASHEGPQEWLAEASTEKLEAFNQLLMRHNGVLRIKRSEMGSDKTPADRLMIWCPFCESSDGFASWTTLRTHIANEYKKELKALGQNATDPSIRKHDPLLLWYWQAYREEYMEACRRKKKPLEGDSSVTSTQRTPKCPQCLLGITGRCLGEHRRNNPYCLVKYAIFGDPTPSGETQPRDANEPGDQHYVLNKIPGYQEKARLAQLFPECFNTVSQDITAFAQSLNNALTKCKPAAAKRPN